MRTKRFVFIAVLILFILTLTGCMNAVNQTFNLKYDVSGMVKEYATDEYLGEVFINVSGDTSVLASSQFEADDAGQNWTITELSGAVTITPTRSEYSFIPSSIEVERPTKGIVFTALPAETGGLINKFIEAMEAKDVQILKDACNSKNVIDYAQQQNYLNQIDEYQVRVINIESFTSGQFTGSASVHMEYDILFHDGAKLNEGAVIDFGFKNSNGTWYIDSLSKNFQRAIDELDVEIEKYDTKGHSHPIYITVPDRFVIETSYHKGYVDTTLELYNSKLEKIESDLDGGENRFSRIETVLQPGLYFLKVSVPDHQTLKYRLTASRVQDTEGTR